VDIPSANKTANHAQVTRQRKLLCGPDFGGDQDTPG
jgi:hypothetical protein